METKIFNKTTFMYKMSNFFSGTQIQHLTMTKKMPEITWYGLYFLTFPKQQIFDSSKLKEFAYDNFKFDENGIKISK